MAATPTPSPETAKALSANAWTKIFESADSEQGPCRGYAVANSTASTNLVEVYVVGLHRASAPPNNTDQGLPIYPGQRERFYSNDPAGPGLITQVWARSTSATIGHGKVHN